MLSLCKTLLCLAFLQSCVMSKVYNEIGRALSVICRNQSGITIPMPGSCNGFYICVNGNAIASSCGSFYHFNSHTGLCEHPLKVGCKIEKQQVENINHTNIKRVTHSLLPKPKTPDEVVADLSVGPICEDLHTGVLLPKSDSCSQYYVCIFQRPYRRTCPPMLHFNATRKLCQDPAMAKCVQPMSNLNTLQNQSMDKLENDDNGMILVYSRCAISPDGTLFPYPGDCGRFIFCMSHNVLTLLCSAGYHFSPKYERCEFPSVAKCQ